MLRPVTDLLGIEIDWPKAATVSLDPADPRHLEERLTVVLGLVQELRDEAIERREQQQAPHEEPAQDG